MYVPDKTWILDCLLFIYNFPEISFNLSKITNNGENNHTYSYW